MTLTKRERELLGEWFARCQDRTDNGHLPSVWLEELEAVVSQILDEASAEDKGEGGT